MKTTRTPNLGGGKKDLSVDANTAVVTEYDKNRVRVTCCDRANIAFCKWVPLLSVTCGKWKIWNSGFAGSFNGALTDYMT